MAHARFKGTYIWATQFKVESRSACTWAKTKNCPVFATNIHADVDIPPIRPLWNSEEDSAAEFESSEPGISHLFVVFLSKYRYYTLIPS